MPTQPTEMASPPLVAPIPAPAPLKREGNVPAGEGDNIFNSISSQDHSQQNKDDGKTALGSKEGSPNTANVGKDAQDDTCSGGSDSSEENAIKSRVIAAAKAAAAKEAAARDALLNPRRTNDKPAADAAPPAQHTRPPVDNNANAYASMGGPSNAALYQSAMLRVQATISSLQHKKERCLGHITADDLELLHSQFDSMLTHHPVYSPNARRSRALAAANAMAQYRKTAMEAQQKQELNRMLQLQLDRQGKDNATAGGAGGTKKGVWAPPTGAEQQNHKSQNNPELSGGASDVWANSQGQHSQASHMTYFPGGASEGGGGGSPSAPGMYHTDSQQQQQPGSSFWPTQSSTHAAHQPLLVPPGQDPRAGTAELLRMLSMIMPQDQAASAYGSFAYDAAAAVPPPQAQTGVDAELAASALVALGTSTTSTEPAPGSKRRGRPTKRYLDQDTGEETTTTTTTRRQRQGSALTEAGPRVLPPPPHIAGSVEAELMSLLAQYSGQ